MSSDFRVANEAFRLNSQKLTETELINLAKEFIDSDEDYKKSFGKFLLEWFDENEFIELTTSGTTGNPKKIKLLKQAMVNSALATSEFFHLPQKTKALHCLSTDYIAGKMMLVRALVCGWDLDVVKPESNPLKYNSNTYDFAAMVPLQVEESFSELNRIGKIIVGGAKLNFDLIQKLKAIKSEIFETYGMTETITHVAVKKIGAEVFSALPGIDFSTDERNCLVINAPKLSSNQIVTNDVVDLVDNHKFIWKGRFDHVINSGGVKLFPEQIEEKLQNKIKQRFFVTGLPDEKFGEKLVLVIEGKPVELNEDVFQSLTRFEKPKEIRFVESFSETETGKIKRKDSLK